MSNIFIRGLNENNLRNVDLEIPKKKIVCFTGVSGSGKSSVVFDTIAAEAKRQMNETYPAFVRNRMPKYERPHFESIRGLSPAVVVDQTAIGVNARSTVGTASELYTGLRLLFSRVGQPFAGSASVFSFNDPKGMCPFCSGMGYVYDIDTDRLLDKEKSLREGAVADSTFKPGGWYLRQYEKSGLFDFDKKLGDFSGEEMNLLLYGSRSAEGKIEDDRVEGVLNTLRKRYLTRNTEDITEKQREKAKRIVSEKTCPQCGGRRLNRIALSTWANGYTIDDMCRMELPKLRKVLSEINDPKVKGLTEELAAGLTRFIDIGLPYLSLSRETATLSGGEAQRLKLESIGKKGSIYILDEPTTGLHPSDTDKLMELFEGLVKKGSSVIIIEHNTDVMKQADYIIDLGPDGGKNGGRIVFAGTPAEMIESSDGITARCLRAAAEGRTLTDAELKELTKQDIDEETEDEMGLKLEPIGRINDSTVELNMKYAPALEGLEGFSHVQVLWWFDGCDNDECRNLLVNCKPYSKGPERMGAFATRSPERPNPIALTTAQITFIDKERGPLGLAYIDALDGTPVLDIKPYTPSLDRADSAEVPVWCRHWPKNLESSGDFDWGSEFNF